MYIRQFILKSSAFFLGGVKRKRKQCEELGCDKSALGITNRCLIHGDDTRCEEPGCYEVGAGSTGRCKAHGGDKHLSQDGEGTANFVNSVSSANKFSVSNSVTELPPLRTLPLGQAPAYEQLINFQRAESRQQQHHQQQYHTVASVDGVSVERERCTSQLSKNSVRCVMCGKRPSDGDSGAVIPQQNKGVCRDCDKALWVHGDTRTYFK